MISAGEKIKIPKLFFLQQLHPQNCADLLRNKANQLSKGILLVDVMKGGRIGIRNPKQSR